MMISEIASDAWLLLLSTGGWWSAAEVERELRLERGSAYQPMFELQATGRLAYRPRQIGRPAQFAVTPGCTVPQGVTLADCGAAGLPLAAVARERTPRPAAQGAARC